MRYFRKAVKWHKDWVWKNEPDKSVDPHKRKQKLTAGDVMIDQWLVNIIIQFISWFIIIIPKIIQNGKAVPKIFKFEKYPITYQVT